MPSALPVCTSDRRSSSRPFRNTARLRAAAARSTSPTAPRSSRSRAGAAQTPVPAPTGLKPVAAGASLIREFVGVQPDEFTWRPPPYEYEHDKMPIDILAGNATFREQIDAQAPLMEIVGSWEAGEGEFRKIRERFLLY